MSRIFWDSNPFIYLFDGQEPCLTEARALRQRMVERGDELVTSTMTLGEVQTGPLRAGRSDKATLYRETIQQIATVIPFDSKAAEMYARLRVNPSIGPPDAIQLSCAAIAGVEIFITNDTSLHRLKVPGIHFITSMAKAPLG